MSTQLLRASASRVAAVARPINARRALTVRAAFRKPPSHKRSLQTKPQKGAAADPGLMTSDKDRDIIVHTIWGEHDFAVFFLFFLVLPFLPIFAPGLVWIARAMTGV